MSEYVVLPVYFCNRNCQKFTPHLLLHEITGPRAIAKCEVCRKTHVIKADEIVVEP